MHNDFKAAGFLNMYIAHFILHPAKQYYICELRTFEVENLAFFFYQQLLWNTQQPPQGLVKAKAEPCSAK